MSHYSKYVRFSRRWVLTTCTVVFLMVNPLSTFEAEVKLLNKSQGLSIEMLILAGDPEEGLSGG